jgi:hypothetical protein
MSFVRIIEVALVTSMSVTLRIDGCYTSEAEQMGNPKSSGMAVPNSWPSRDRGKKRALVEKAAKQFLTGIQRLVRGAIGTFPGFGCSNTDCMGDDPRDPIFPIIIESP